MKTTSLVKAPMGTVAFVIDPNTLGYTELVNIPVGKITFQELIDGMKRAIETSETAIEGLQTELAKVKTEFANYKQASEKDIANLQARVKAIELVEVNL